MKLSAPLISVIIPVYNVESFLMECLDSVIGQTYLNLEIILINDGSTDNCLNICREYEKKDNRIRVIDQKNQGLSGARNTGLNNIKGRYVIFIDSDDIIANKCIEELYNALISTHTKIACCGKLDFIKKISLKPSLNPVYAYKTFDSDSAIKEILLDRDILTSAWGKLFEASLFQDIRFPQNAIYEDIATIWKTFIKVEKIVLVNSQLYYYRNNPMGIMNSKVSIKQLDIIKSHDELINYLDKYKKGLSKIAKARLARYCVAFLDRMEKQKNKDLSLKKSFKQVLKKNLYDLLFSEFKIKFKIGALYFLIK